MCSTIWVTHVAKNNMELNWLNIGNDLLQAWPVLFTLARSKSQIWQVLLTFGSIDVLYEYSSHPWCVVLMLSLIFLPRILHYIEFVYTHCYSHRLRIQDCVCGRLRLYCSMTNEDLTFTRDFNMPTRVRVHVNVTQLDPA